MVFAETKKKVDSITQRLRRDGYAFKNYLSSAVIFTLTSVVTYSVTYVVVLSLSIERWVHEAKNAIF